MLRREGEVFLFGTAISAPVSHLLSQKNALSPHWQDQSSLLEEAAGVPAAGLVTSRWPIAISTAVASRAIPWQPMQHPIEQGEMLVNVLPTTLIAAGLAALINFWLAMRVGQVRTKEKVSVGDGGNESVIRRMRAHANFVEFTPIVLILIAVIELAKGPGQPAWLFWVAALYMLGRAAHGIGMDGLMPARTVGTITTMLTTVGLGIYAITLAYSADGQITKPTPSELQGAEAVGEG